MKKNFLKVLASLLCLGLYLVLATGSDDSSSSNSNNDNNGGLRPVENIDSVSSYEEEVEPDVDPDIQNDEPDQAEASDAPDDVIQNNNNNMEEEALGGIE